MERMEIGDWLIKGNEELRQEVREFFSRLYGEKFEWKSKLDDINF